jgi:membrane protease YdiL (CAAX protease family)
MNEYCKSLSKSRTLLHIVALIGVMFVGDFLSSLPFDIIFRYIELPHSLMYGVLRVAASVIVTYLIFRFYTNKVLHSNMEDFRIGRLYIKFTDVVYAFLLPTFVIVGFVIVGRPFYNHNLTNDVMTTIVFTALFRALKAGILEEILFRGYIMKLIEIKWNKYIAIIIPSFVFSLAHIPSMQEFNFVSLLFLISSGTLVGIMFSLVAYKSNSIWGSALIHTIWNLIMISNILRIYFGESANSKSIISIILPSDNPLLTGAGFGIEASIFAIVGYLIISTFILISIKKSENRDKENLNEMSIISS